MRTSATDLLRAALAPLYEFTVLVPLLMFWTLIALGIWGGVLGIFLLALTLPPLFRFLSFIAYFASSAWGSAGPWFVIVLAAGIVPPSLAVLAITHSALQALNPLALLRVYDRAGPLFLLAPLYVLVLVALTIAVGGLPLWARIFTTLFTMFSVAALCGALIAPVSLVTDVDIPDPARDDPARLVADTEKSRMLALTHAYGFISRNNRQGGFEHLFEAIGKDADPAGAWDWFFNRMLDWEQKNHALFFAQHYVRDALRHGEEKRALKATMRCLYENEEFRPFREDVPALAEAAERSGNTELAEVLKRA